MNFSSSPRYIPQHELDMNMNFQFSIFFPNLLSVYTQGLRIELLIFNLYHARDRGIFRPWSVLGS